MSAAVFVAIDAMMDVVAAYAQEIAARQCERYGAERRDAAQYYSAMKQKRECFQEGCVADECAEQIRTSRFSYEPRSWIAACEQTL